MAAASIHSSKGSFNMSEERKRMYEEYRKLGMTEDQIEEISRFDDEVEKSDQDFYEHTFFAEDLL